jgi:protein TonB
MKDITKHRPFIFRLSLLLSIAFCFLCFQITIPVKDYSEQEIRMVLKEEMIEVTRMHSEPKPKIPIPTRIDQVKEIVSETIIKPNDEEMTEPVPIKKLPASKTSIISNAFKTVPSTPPAISPVNPYAKVEEPVLIAERMPVFGECSGLDPDELRACSDRNVIAYIKKQFHYPSMAKEIGIEGTAVIEFVVEKDGTLTGLKVLRDPGAGCGEEVMRIVKNMPKWRPGIQSDRPVRVLFRLPVRLALE